MPVRLPTHFLQRNKSLTRILHPGISDTLATFPLLIHLNDNLQTIGTIGIAASAEMDPMESEQFLPV